jgi:hypothetical protein
MSHLNPKTELSEYCNSRHIAYPEYVYNTKTSGDGLIFSCMVTIDGSVVESDWHLTKKEASKDAASKMLNVLRKEPTKSLQPKGTKDLVTFKPHLTPEEDMEIITRNLKISEDDHIPSEEGRSSKKEGAKLLTPSFFEFGVPNSASGPGTRTETRSGTGTPEMKSLRPITNRSLVIVIEFDSIKRWGRSAVESIPDEAMSIRYSKDPIFSENKRRVDRVFSSFDRMTVELSIDIAAGRPDTLFVVSGYDRVRNVMESITDILKIPHYIIPTLSDFYKYL